MERLQRQILEGLVPQKQDLEEWLVLYDICNCPPPQNLEVGTVIMPTGDRLDRALRALELFKVKYAGQATSPHLVVSGAHSHPDLAGGGASAEKVVRILRIFGQLTTGMKKHLIAEPQATNTKEQAENIYGMLERNEIRQPLVVVVSAYHLPRLVSTFVKTILNREGKNLKTKLYTVPVILEWDSYIRGEKIRGKRYEQIKSEIARIKNYQGKGDVATKEEVQRYFNWLKINQ